MTLQTHIVTRLLSLTDSRKVIGNLHNSVRYLFKFYISAFVEFNNLLSLCRYFRADMVRSLSLMKVVARKMNLNESEKDKELVVEEAVKKFAEYRRRDLEKEEEQISYLRKHHGQEYKDMDRYFELLQSARRNMVELSQRLESDKRQIEELKRMVFLLREQQKGNLKQSGLEQRPL
jgi:hypothetical protein